MLRSISILIFGTILFHLPAEAQQQASGPAQELLEYVREARKAGLQDPQIRQNALNAGWPSATVVAAIEHGSGEKSKTPGNPNQPAGNDAAATPANEGASSAGSPIPASETTSAAGGTPKLPPPASLAVGSENKIESLATGTKPAVLNHGVPDEYRIGEGDLLQISVWGEPTASVNSIVVRPDGKITLPLIKDIAVAGLTPSDAEKTITEKLSADIKAPDVTVIVTAINSKKIFLVGAVKKEGPIAYTYRMTVMQAISEAGGLTDYAKRKKIYVLRNENGRQYQLPFDYDAVLKGQRMELNYTLQPGDTLVVPH